jgi:hippurate hydrolase
MQLKAEILAFEADLVAWRHDFHRHPELGFEEHRTAGLVAERLRGFGLEVHTGIGRTGVVGVLKGRLGPGPTIGIRADMDALPMQEENRFAHRSTQPGKFHGCGHDGHTTMLLGAARYLAATRNFRGQVVFIFQPAEEGLAGGKAMVEDGLFERFPCDQVYAAHNWPEEPLGTVVVRSGAIMAASDFLDIEIEGVGAHAAMPHRGVDPVLVACHVVTALQSLVARNVNPQDAAVLSITKIEAGSAYNVIPRTVLLSGTCRTFDPQVRDLMEAGIERVATGVAAAFGASARLAYRRNYPPTVNTSAETEVVRRAAARVVGAENVVSDRKPSMGGEDFAFLLERRPGSYVWLGQGGGPSACNVHHPQYDFNDALLPLGASLWASLVEGGA